MLYHKQGISINKCWDSLNKNISLQKKNYIEICIRLEWKNSLFSLWSIITYVSNGIWCHQKVNLTFATLVQQKHSYRYLKRIDKNWLPTLGSTFILRGLSIENSTGLPDDRTKQDSNPKIWRVQMKKIYFSNLQFLV